MTKVSVSLDPVFTRMLEKQRMLQEMIYQKPFSSFTDEERMEAIRMNTLALISELNEMLSETGWKPWATSNHINREAAHSEMVDVWHFFMNLMLHLGMTTRDLATGYDAKNAKNWIRYQNRDYDGVSSKCPGCKRDYNDAGVECANIAPINAAGKPKDRWCGVYGHIYNNGKTDKSDRCPGCGGEYPPPGQLPVGCLPRDPGEGGSDAFCIKTRKHYTPDGRVA